MPLLPLRRGIPCLTERCDKVFLELVDELRREPLEVAALGLLVVAAAAFWRSKKRLCAVAILGAVALQACARGRLETWAATAQFPAASCRALGIVRLQHVPAYDPLPTVVVDQMGHSWRQGHRRWPVCDAPRCEPLPAAATSPGPVVLITLDRAYASVVAGWAELVRAANLTCVVGSIDRSGAVCAEARQARCRCLPSARLPAVRSSDWGRGSPRRVAVRARFELAQRLLGGALGVDASGGVLLHDADVAFDDLGPFACFLRRTAPHADLVSQPNGPTHDREAYDALNLGLLWLSSAPSTRLLLDCVLASWDHAAFDPVAGEEVPGGSYYERSQPRIGHLLEEHLAARQPAAGPVRVCTLPPWLKQHYAHATGKAPTVTSKLDRLRQFRRSSSTGAPSLSYQKTVR